MEGIMKCIFLVIMALLFFSCTNRINYAEISDDTHIFDDESEDVTEVPDEAEVDDSELPDTFSMSVTSIKDKYNPYGDIIFGDTLGNFYYSKTDKVNEYKDNTDDSNTRMLLKLNIEGGTIWQSSFLMAYVYDLYIYDYTFSEKTGAIYLTGAGTFEEIGTQLFIIKIGAFGEQEWIQFWSSGTWGYPLAIDVDSEENIYVAGGISGAFDGQTAGKCQDRLESCYDAFVTKWNKDGTLLWTKQSGEETTDIIQGMVIDDSDILHLVGTKGTRTYVTGVCDQVARMFLWAWDSDGNEIWSERDDYQHGIYGVDVDMMDRDIVIFGQKCFEEEFNHREAQPYLQKYDGTGKLLWEKNATNKNGKETPMYAIKLSIKNTHIFTLVDIWDKQQDNSNIMANFLNKSGEVFYSKAFSSPCQDYPEHITTLLNGQVMITGISDGWIGDDITTAECESEMFKPFVMVLTPPETD